MKKFSLEMEVRDNELDAQGIVNNAHYMIYLSHARHKHGVELGIDHTDFAQKGLNLIVTSCMMKFKNPLLANNKFIVTSTIVPGELPFHWSHRQDIKTTDGKIILKAIFDATCVNINADDNNKLFIPTIIESILNEHAV